MFCTIVEPGTTNEGKFYSDICRRFPTTLIRGNKHIYVVYVHDCNTILTTAMKNRSDKYMILSFIEFTEDLKTQGINPGLNFMENEALAELKMTISTMNIKYQLPPPK